MVYAELTEKVPALINYFYINNEYPHMFQSHYFDKLDRYSTFGDAFSAIRRQMINQDKNVYSGYPSVDYDFNSRILLLDSGASNIVKQIAKSVGYNTKQFYAVLFEHMKKYYDFANRYQFDIVVGFDLGGKYTFKDGETNDANLIEFYQSLDVDRINYELLLAASDYLKTKTDYYPKVLATVHGRTPSEYREYVKRIQTIEGYEFWGYALGGVASSKGIDSSWLDDIDFRGTPKRLMSNAVVSAKAVKIVREVVGEKPIHALGCGGYVNIPMNYYLGATSFDAASPSRRVGDGNDLSVEYLFSNNPPRGAKYSKLLVGGYTVESKLLPEELDYVTIHDVSDSLELCGCAACRFFAYARRLKELYAMKPKEQEAHYLARQLMNMHSVNQHTNICKKVSLYQNMREYCANNDTELNRALLKIYNQIQR